ncbi:MAG: hypothetical protein KBS81_10825 [Spirochaetales bacterium]|nr:hypothetical protein [Candidatus Physcosoma equi]
MEKWLMDFDEFMGEHVIISSFTGATMEGTFTDYDDDYVELEVEGEFLQIPIEPIRNIRRIED